MTLSATDLAFGERIADISLVLEPGTITAICGPNGAGKSTLLQCLAGLLPAGRGVVSLAGENLAALHPRDRAKAIGYLPQESEVAWDVSVRNLVALGRLPHRDRGEAHIDAALAALDLERLAHRPVSRLSGGERSRALLARVLAGTPRWILADEPLAALDLAHQIALVGLLRQAADDGTGVVLVVHDLAMAMNHADRVLVLEGGRMIANAAPHLALSPHNIARAWQVEARWLRDGDRWALVTR